MAEPLSQMWQRLADYTIGPDQAFLSFEQRLARENRWDSGFAARVMTEYKRFCYLAVTADHEVTPPDAVDQAWHLHLTYSRDYWNRFCPHVLGAPLHHGPTAGGTAERSRYYDQYARTLQSYEAHFGAPAPADIWPPAARRFGVDPQAVRVNPHDVVIIPRSIVRYGIIGSCAAVTVAAIAGGLVGWICS